MARATLRIATAIANGPSYLRVHAHVINPTPMCNKLCYSLLANKVKFRVLLVTYGPLLCPLVTRFICLSVFQAVRWNVDPQTDKQMHSRWLLQLRATRACARLFSTPSAVATGRRREWGSVLVVWDDRAAR